MNRKYLLLLVLAGLFTQYSCSHDKKSKKNSSKDSTKVAKASENYNIYKLPADLDEISGISFIDNSNLVCVEDEQGIVYFYDLDKGKISSKKEFAGPGDFEDLVIAGNDLYVINSDGDLYGLKNFKSATSDVQKYKTPFTGKNNIEGLAYDAQNNRLLLAPKDKGLDGDKDKEIYAFDLKTKKLINSPVYSIRLKEIEEYFKGDAIEESSKKFLKALGNENLNKIFRPSAITVHPVSHNIYVLSSINNMIAVLNPKGALVRIIELKGSDFLQPEGIAFSPEGKLYVSNEGKGGKANIIYISL